MSDEIRNVNQIQVSDFTIAEMRSYYAKDKKIISLLNKLEKVRDTVKNSGDVEANRPRWLTISDLKKEIRDLQMEFYKKLPKKTILGIDASSRAGIVRAHPGNATFTISKELSATLPADQADEIIAEGLAVEVK